MSPSWAQQTWSPIKGTSAKPVRRATPGGWSSKRSMAPASDVAACRPTCLPPCQPPPPSSGDVDQYTNPRDGSCGTDSPHALSPVKSLLIRRVCRATVLLLSCHLGPQFSSPPACGALSLLAAVSPRAGCRTLGAPLPLAQPPPILSWRAALLRALARRRPRRGNLLGRYAESYDGECIRRVRHSA